MCETHLRYILSSFWTPHSSIFQTFSSMKWKNKRIHTIANSFSVKENLYNESVPCTSARQWFMDCFHLGKHLTFAVLLILVRCMLLHGKSLEPQTMNKAYTKQTIFFYLRAQALLVKPETKGQSATVTKVWPFEIDFSVVFGELPKCYRIPQTTCLKWNLMAVDFYWPHCIDPFWETCSLSKWWPSIRFRQQTLTRWKEMSQSGAE